MNNKQYIVYHGDTLKVIDTFGFWGKRIMNLLDTNGAYRWINTTHPAHQDILARLNKPVQSTHLIDYGTGFTPEIGVVCGNYYRALRHYVFDGTLALTAWARIPAGAKLIPCVSPMIESVGSGMLNTADNL